METLCCPDLVNPDTGKTIKEENLELIHNIPLGSLVEVKLDKWFGNGACMKVHARLWVIKHSRDCDGTPLYNLSEWKDAKYFSISRFSYTGFDENRLKVIKVTDDIADGMDALEWTEKELEND